MILVDEQGKILSFLKTQGANYQSIGIERSVQVLNQAVQQVLDRCNLRKDDLTYAFFGFAGADSQYEIEIVKSILARLGLLNYDFDNDGRIALRSGTLDDIGIMISCGTGGINFASDGKKILRIGGFSGFFGERLGSYLIAGRVASAIVRAKDGRDESTIMKEIFESKIGEPIENIMHYEYEESGTENFRKYAVELIKTLFEAASQFDHVALRILGEIVLEIVKIVNAFRRTLDLKTPIKLVLEGSFFKNSPSILLKMIESAVGKDYKLIVPKHPPVFGAILLAYERIHYKPSKQVIESLLKQLEVLL